MEHVGTSSRHTHQSGCSLRLERDISDCGTRIWICHSWGGRLCLSRNSVPAFGEIEPGFFSACCQNGLGTAKGTLSGIGAVELATRSNSPIVQDLQSYDSPRLLPPKPIAKLGATIVLKWREWKAGAEI